jgi:uncharacterized DUF497 family protein
MDVLKEERLDSASSINYRFRAWNSNGTRQKAKPVSSNEALILPMQSELFATRIASSAPIPRWNYGEDRYQLLGSIETRVFFLVYTLRGETIRIISARKANRREVQRYENATR